jgi:hypothetical protein
MSSLDLTVEFIRKKWGVSEKASNFLKVILSFNKEHGFASQSIMKDEMSKYCPGSNLFECAEAAKEEGLISELIIRKEHVMWAMDELQSFRLNLLRIGAII